MASILGSVAVSAFSAVAFSGTNLLFSLIKDNGSEERKRANKAREKLEKVQMEWSRDRQKKLDSYNRYLREQNQASSDISDIHQAAALYFELTGKKQETFREEPVLSDFYHPSEQQKTGELLFIFTGLTLAGYFVYKYI